MCYLISNGGYGMQPLSIWKPTAISDTEYLMSMRLMLVLPPAFSIQNGSYRILDALPQKGMPPRISFSLHSMFSLIWFNQKLNADLKCLDGVSVDAINFIVSSYFANGFHSIPNETFTAFESTIGILIFTLDVSNTM